MTSASLLGPSFSPGLVQLVAVGVPQTVASSTASPGVGRASSSARGSVKKCRGGPWSSCCRNDMCSGCELAAAAERWSTEGAGVGEEGASAAAAGAAAIGARAGLTGDGDGRRRLLRGGKGRGARERAWPSDVQAGAGTRKGRSKGRGSWQRFAGGLCCSPGAGAELTDSSTGGEAACARGSA